MTTSSENCRAVRSWTGAEASFATGFKAAAATDVVVTSWVEDAPTLLTSGVHYTSALAGDGELIVTPLALPDTPATLVIERKTPAVQTLALSNAAPFDAPALEAELDRLSMSAAENRDLASRALHVTGAALTGPELGPLTGHAGEMLVVAESETSFTYQTRQNWELGDLPVVRTRAAAGAQNIFAMADAWNDADTTFTAIGVDVTDLASYWLSKLLDLKVGGGTVFKVSKTGELVISKSDGTSLGGIKRAGNAGEMALTSQVHPSTGAPADVVRWYWDSPVGQVAVLHGMGTNRLSIESEAAITHIAKNSRFEWEGWTSPTIDFVAYEAASGNGKPFNFNNWGQNPTTSDLLYLTTGDLARMPLTVRHQTGSATWINRLTIDGYGTINQTLADNVAALSIAGGALTGAATTSLIDMTRTWNTSGAATAIKLAVTDTASAAGSKLIDLLVGGASKFSVDKTGAVVVAGSLGSSGASLNVNQTLAIAPAVNTAALTLSGTGQTGANSGSLVDAATTWNTTGSPTAIKLNVTNTASGAAAALLDLQVGGASKFSVDKAGNIAAVGQISSQAAIRATDGAGSNGFAFFRGGASGKVELWDHAGNSAGSMFIFGNHTAAYAALKRDATTNGLQARLGDDSGFTFLQGKLRTDTAYTAGAPTATGYIVVYDSGGTAYKVPAVAA